MSISSLDNFINFVNETILEKKVNEAERPYEEILVDYVEKENKDLTDKYDFLVDSEFPDLSKRIQALEELKESILKSLRPPPGTTRIIYDSVKAGYTNSIEFFYLACMALLNLYRKKRQYYDGSELIRNLETKFPAFKTRPFFLHMDARFYAEKVIDIKTYEEAKEICEQAKEIEENEIKRIIGPSATKKEVEKRVNVGAYVHFALCVIRAKEFGLQISEDDLKIAIDEITIAIESRGKIFSSAYGYRGILHYYNKDDKRAISDLRTAMKNEDPKNKDFFLYNDRWKSFLFLATESSKTQERTDEMKSLIEKQKIDVVQIKKEYMNLLTIFTALMTIVFSFIQFANQSALCLNALIKFFSVSFVFLLIFFLGTNLLLALFMSNPDSKDQSWWKRPWFLGFLFLVSICAILFTGYFAASIF